VYSEFECVNISALVRRPVINLELICPVNLPVRFCLVSLRTQDIQTIHIYKRHMIFYLFV
jgi:hypothetical protein